MVAWTGMVAVMYGTLSWSGEAGGEIMGEHGWMLTEHFGGVWVRENSPEEMILSEN